MVCTQPDARNQIHFYDTSNKEVKISKTCIKYWWLVFTFIIAGSWQPDCYENTNHRATHLFEIMWFTPIIPPSYTSLRAFPVNFVTCSTWLLWGNLLADIFSSALLSSLVFLCAVQRVAQLRHSDRHCRVGAFTKSCLYQRTIPKPLSNRSDSMINKSRVI